MATQEIKRNAPGEGPAEGDKKQEWAEMSDDAQSEEEQVVEKVIEKPKPPPARKGKKNTNGDYIV